MTEAVQKRKLERLRKGKIARYDERDNRQGDGQGRGVLQRSRQTHVRRKHAIQRRDRR